MPIPLADGSVVGDGSQIGMLPVLADQPLDKPSTLLRSAANPRMDLVLLVVKDAASSSAPAATAPPGMSAAQFALVQRMLAARQRGAQAATGGAVPEPKRGPQIHLVLWRLGDDSSVVWSVALRFDKVMDAQAASQEHEDVHLHDVAWSPQGDRLGVLASVRRSPVAASSTTPSRTTTFFRSYSVQDGRLLSTVAISPTTQTSPDETKLAHPMALQWVQVDLAPTAHAVDGSIESLLSKLQPLPELPSADTFASARGTANLMPHQLRMMQMSGQKPPPGFEYPSQLALQGRGMLARIPQLAKSNADLGLVEGGDGRLGLEDDSPLPVWPETVVVVSDIKGAQATLLLDGHISIGSVQTASSALPEQGHQAVVSRIVSISRNMAHLNCLATTTDAVMLCTRVHLPFGSAMRYGPCDARRRIVAMSRSSHLVRFYAGYALDVASAMQQVYQNELVQKVTKEWTKHMDELSVKFGGDMKYELINVLLTGRAGAAAEQLLLGNLTEGVLTRLEQQTHTAMYWLKRLIADNLRPALERAIVCLSGLVGQARFFGTQHDGLQNAMRVLQATLDSTLSLANEVDVEAVVSQEFYRWCRTERERQERIKQDQDEPRLPITYDVHTVANYIDRGFENSETEARLAPHLAEEAIERISRGKEQGTALKEALQEAKRFLASKEGVHARKAQQEERKDVVAIVPTLARAIELLASCIVPMLEDEMKQAVTEPTTASRGGDGWVVRQEAATMSLSSPSEEHARLDCVCSSSFVCADTMLAAYVLRPTDDVSSAGSSIVVVRQHSGSSEVEKVELTVPSVGALEIVDVGFFSDAELLVLAWLSATSTSILLCFNVAHLKFGQQGKVEHTPSRATEFDSELRAAKLAVNTNKQTVIVMDGQGKRVVYLDISVVDMAHVPMMQDEA